MAIKVALNHQTHYKFDRRVNLSPHVVRLRPAPHSRTPIESYSLNIRPENHFINWMQDPFGNYEARLIFPEKTRELFIEVDLVAEMTVINPFDFFVEEYAEHYPFEYDELLGTELAPYLEVTESPKILRKWIATHKPDEKLHIVDTLVALNQQLEKDIGYNIRMEPGIQSCKTTLKKATGSCRDSAWLLVQILRHLGLAARFVSGYLVQLTADEKSLDGPSGPENDFTDLHAWCEVFIPGAGWVGLDPTSGLFAGEGHIPLSCTPDPTSAAPVTGFTDKCESEFFHSNSVQRIHEDPRVTKPYTDDQWSNIEALGEQVEADLLEHDVRLTMGGEPTFVSIDDMESAQWNTAALGDHKRALAGDLFLRLRDAFAPGSLVQYAQGKWYPGEEIPRWALNCFWRKDGAPIWSAGELIAKDDISYDFGQADAETFAHTLTKHLGVSKKYAQPAYEDMLYYLWQEGNQPTNLDPEKLDLKTPLDRQALARVLTNGLDTPAGYVLPLQWNYNRAAWDSAMWPLRREHIFLIPGDSPMGLRLPLNSLPWVAEEEQEPTIERSPFEETGPLGDFEGEVSQRYSHELAAEEEHPEVIEQLSGDMKPAEKVWKNVPHTAMCIEARGGLIHIFLPPLNYLEHYLDLVSAVEATAKKLNIPVRLEGYSPPKDHRINSFAVTPDPGVIEVNIHPAHSWQELVHNTQVVYDQARLARLGTEKFMLDGRHSGTGGGNHVTLGGPTPADSPLLRRPDLLRSLLTYWQHHPALSYLFSGLFIGPTSQAPRVDEGRDEKLYELEIAFSQMPAGETTQLWLVDRLLRHLLTDITGNTHRSEFCIDKLYSPDSASGRQGILEFRGFEMPPHPRMSLVQALLLRTLLMLFWKQPYHKPLVRWGTELHDRFMLGHHVAADMREVVRDLNDGGYPFKFEWLAPFLEFRFPVYGRIQSGDIQIEVSGAIEPWHVLGEESSNTGTARFVDSSVERLQVRVEGLSDNRYVLTCNGRRIPLRNTGVHGEYVAGIRYRAWNPPSALHPTIGIHAPLVIDLVDSWNGRAVAGCTYHVQHPGGRNTETYPVNAYEAEARRGSRFWHHGHTPTAWVKQPLQRGERRIDEREIQGMILDIPLEPVNPDYPYTLDMRTPGA